jgi:hypothetical protein
MEIWRGNRRSSVGSVPESRTESASPQSPRSRETTMTSSAASGWTPTQQATNPDRRLNWWPFVCGSCAVNRYKPFALSDVQRIRIQKQESLRSQTPPNERMSNIRGSKFKAADAKQPQQIVAWRSWSRGPGESGVFRADHSDHKREIEHSSCCSRQGVSDTHRG